jgi:hypothetical protein
MSQHLNSITAKPTFNDPAVVVVVDRWLLSEALNSKMESKNVDYCTYSCLPQEF